MISEGFVNLLLVGLLVGYTALGGWLFYTFERPREHEEFIDAQTVWNETMTEVTKEFLLFSESELQDLLQRSHADQLTGIRTALDWFLNRMNVSEPQDGEAWDTMWKSAFFSATLYTTIGYGDRAPATMEGRAVAIVYSLIGIPVMLIILNSWGKLMFKFMKVWWFLCLRLLRCIPCCRCFVPNLSMGTVQSVLKNEDEGEEVRIPTTVAFGVLFSWLCGFAGLYILIWNDDWTFFESFYFFFISLTTIGLGDYVPKTADQFYWGFPMIILGLSVISLCISVIQNNVEGLFHDMMHKVDEQYRSNLGSDNMQMGMGAFSMRGDTFKEKLMIKMMDKTKLDMLQSKVESRSKMQNSSTQTVIHRTEMCIQAGDPLPKLDWGDAFSNPADADEGNQGGSIGGAGSRKPSGYSKFGKKSYIYSVTD